MKSSKSAQLIITKDSLNKRDINTIVIKPAVDTRSSSGMISSRIGIECKADYIIDEDKADANLAQQIFNEAVRLNAPIFIDEVQFINTLFLETLIHRIQRYNGYADNIELYMYGLLKNYKGKLFEASKFLVENVDNLIEIETFCDMKNCNNKATYSFLNSKADSIINIGDSTYNIYCPKHFYQLSR